MECISDVWVNQFNQVGLPVALLAMMFYAIYRFARWIAPRIDTWVSNYIEIQDKKAKILEESSNKCVDMQTLNLEAVKELTVTLKLLERKIS